MLESMYVIYTFGGLLSLTAYALFAILALGIRASGGIARYARVGKFDHIDVSWWIFDFEGGNHPVGLAIDTIFYTIFVLIAALGWLFTIIPAVIAMLSKIKRSQFLKAKEAERVMERLSHP